MGWEAFKMADPRVVLCAAWWLFSPQKCPWNGPRSRCIRVRRKSSPPRWRWAQSTANYSPRYSQL